MSQQRAEEYGTKGRVASNGARGPSIPHGPLAQLDPHQAHPSLSPRTRKRKMQGMVKGNKMHGVTETNGTITGFGEVPFAIPNGIGMDQEALDTEGYLTPQYSNQSSRNEYQAHEQAKDEMMFQRIRSCIIYQFEQEGRLLHQQVAEALSDQQKVLRESLLRIEGAQSKNFELVNSMHERLQVESSPGRGPFDGIQAAHTPLTDRSDMCERPPARVPDEPFVDLVKGDAEQIQESTEDTTGEEDLPKLLNTKGHVISSVKEYAKDLDGDDFSREGARKVYLLQQARNSKHAVIRDGLTHMAHLCDWWEHCEEPPRTGILATVVNNPLFETVSMGCVVADQCLTTWTTDYSMRHATEELPAAARAASLVFNAFFCVELILKILLHRMFFFIMPTWKMNCLDLFLVAYSFLEAVAMRLSFLRILRMFKMAKIVRMLKALTAVHDLRIMLDCLIGSFFGLFWALVLIGVLMYIFALIFVQALTEHMIHNNISQENQDDIQTYFGTVGEGLITVYKCLTGGMDWGDIYFLLEPAGIVAGPACLCMVSFFTISVWNIITSVFIEKAMQMARPTLREMVKEHKLQARQDSAEVAALINKLDISNKGFVNKDEFKHLCQDKEIQEFLSVRDLELKNVTDLDGFYAMLAHLDPTSVTATQVSVRALIENLLHLKGHATNLDMHKRLFEARLYQQSIMRTLEIIRAEIRGKSASGPSNGTLSNDFRV